MSEYEDPLYLYHCPSDADSVGDGEASDPDDPQKLLNDLLGELDNLTLGLDTTSRPISQAYSSIDGTSHLDPDDHNVGLDDILGQLSALGSQMEQAMKQKWPSNTGKTGGVDNKVVINSAKQGHIRTSSGNQKVRFDGLNLDILDGITKMDSGTRTDSPDNDSAFSDNVSMLSSESSASSGGSGSRGTVEVPKIVPAAIPPSHQCVQDVSEHLVELMAIVDAQTPADESTLIKTDKIRLALARVKGRNKVYIKAFFPDKSTKSLLVDEKMSVQDVTRRLADKSHYRMDLKWSLVEYLPILHLERAYEDHEMFVDNVMSWDNDSTNKIFFLARPEKCDIFTHPEKILLPATATAKQKELDDEGRNNLLEEFFSTSGVPQVEGPLYLRSDTRKVWKRYNFVLRASGLYYWSKGKSKSAIDLTCLATFDINQIYNGLSWKKKNKAPTDYCFAIKRHELQAKSSKYIKCLCADSEEAMARWINGIRLAKYGRRLWESYRNLVDELAQEEMDSLANARSCSVVSVPNQTATTNGQDSISRTNGQDSASRTLSVQGSLKSSSGSSSSGLSSERCGSEHAFESDCPPIGTIKRKPSMTPKIPLTTTTRLLVKEAESCISDGTNTVFCNFRKKSVGEETRRKSVETPTKVEVPFPPLPPPKVEEVFLDIDSLPPPPPEFLQDPSPCPSPPLPPPPELEPPGRLSSPPREFLNDLQRVMQKKWQVAQKCALDTGTSPHEVLGFRDPPPPPDFRQSKVRAWVQEHYGEHDEIDSPKKRIPPPPPKRNETTQLSFRKH